MLSYVYFGSGSHEYRNINIDIIELFEFISKRASVFHRGASIPKGRERLREFTILIWAFWECQRPGGREMCFFARYTQWNFNARKSAIKPKRENTFELKFSFQIIRAQIRERTFLFRDCFLSLKFAESKNILLMAKLFYKNSISQILFHKTNATYRIAESTLSLSLSFGKQFAHTQFP